MYNPLMKCGHVANATRDGKPICIICLNIIDGADEIANTTPNLKNRKSKCLDCGKTTESNFDLPFFKYRKNEMFDSHYCGCKGWD